MSALVDVGGSLAAARPCFNINGAVAFLQIF